jgi:rhamnogalacturonan acetylesterase
MKANSLYFAALFLLVTFLFVTSPGQTKDDPHPVVDDSKIKQEAPTDPKLPTLFIVGDSTLKSDAPLRGWGQELAQFFDLKKINVVNRAIGGRSSRSFQYEGRWEKVLAEMKAGDFVLIQFGHNDVAMYNDPAAKDRPSVHGEDNMTALVTRADGKQELVHTFGWYMRKYGDDVKAKGATAIFCSMVPHKDWADGKIVRKEQDTYMKWTANAARQTGAAFIDLNNIIALEFERLGPEKVAPLFGDARTHSTPAGALLNAQMVISGIKALKKPNLKKYLSEQGKSIMAAPAVYVKPL